MNTHRSLTLAFGALCATSALLTTSACSSSSESGGSTSSNAAYSTENVNKVIAAYSGEDKGLPTTFGKARAGSKVIGWSAANAANELNARLGDSITSAVRGLGGTVKAQDAGLDPSKQATQVQQFINDKVDAIVVWPVDAASLAPVVKQANAAGIPVLAMESDPSGKTTGGFNAQIIYGRDMEAYVSAELMDQVHPDGEVGVLGLAVPVATIAYYTDRANYWAAKAGLKVVETVKNPDDQEAGGQSVVGPLLSKYPDLAGVLAYNDPTAIGAQTAARSAGRTLTAFAVNGQEDGLTALKEGKIQLDIQPPLADWGVEFANAAYLLSDSMNASIPKVIFPGIGSVYTSENVADAKTLSAQIAESK